MPAITLTPNNVTSMSFFGSETPPETLDQYNPLSSRVVTVDTAAYMVGPGRFALPVRFELIQKFFTDNTVALTPNTTYSLAQIEAMYGPTPTLPLQQYDYKDGMEAMTAISQAQINALDAQLTSGDRGGFYLSLAT